MSYTPNPVGQAFTPVWTQTATITATNNNSRFIQIGKSVTYYFSLIATSAGTAGGAISIALPVTAFTSGTFRGAGACHYYQATAGGTPSYVLIPYLGSTSTVMFTSNTSAGNNFGAAPAVTVTSGDYIDGVVIYEAA